MITNAYGVSNEHHYFFADDSFSKGFTSEDDLMDKTVTVFLSFPFEMLMGSMLAGIAFANSPVAAVHALAYPIGGTFHVSHGLSNALVLPDVLRFNSSNEYAASAYAYLGKIVFPKADMRGSDKKIAFMFSDQLQALSEDLGLPTRLRDLKIPQEACQQLAVDSMQQTRLLVNNPREMSESDALKIYETAW